MIWRFHIVVITVLAAAVLAGCGGSQLPIGTSRGVPQAPASTSYQSLHSFGKGSDGRKPKAALIDVAGALYGTTYGGGAGGDGSVFSMSTTGTEKVVYSFQGGNDGANPSASLLAVKSVLYGTTEFGGATKYESGGTVFRISTVGVEKVLHRFHGYNDGGHYYYDGLHPVANLIDVKGKLYGTTYQGGDDSSCFSCGTVYSISTSGKEKVLHSFEAYADGISPLANLIEIKGTLYGTTFAGVGQTGSNLGAGTVFSISTTGAENVLYNFPYGGSNGSYLAAGLININGILYGTTGYGGAYASGYGHYGTAFSITTSGSLTTLHSFGSGTDGGRPAAPLLNVKGTLYGTTEGGGTYGKGTVFSMSLTGADEKVLHSFGHGSDGSTPLAGLIDVNGTLYSTTSAGGKYGKGTVFALTP